MKRADKPTRVDSFQGSMNTVFTDTIFLIGHREVGLPPEPGDTGELQSVYPIFTDNASRVRGIVSGASIATQQYPTRDFAFGTAVVSVTFSGARGTFVVTNQTPHWVIGLCV
jgi:hypothetical protein